MANRVLSDDFFYGVGELTNFPSHSSVLSFRHGYRELFEHFNRSKLKAVPLFGQLVNEITLGLRSIDKLYEIWCFYKVCELVLGSGKTLESWQEVLDEGELILQSVIANDKYEIIYNAFYNRANQNSYSVLLKPDIVVKEKDSGDLFVFDAKYRVRNLFDDDGNLKVATNQASDLHKMHTYLDAIPNCKSAIALYVGNTFTFYQRHDFNRVYSNPVDSFRLNGVGAMPFVPDKLDSGAEQFFSSRFP